MAQTKLTVKRGGNRLADVAVTTGTPIAGSDAMELNIDYTRITRGDALIQLDMLRQKIFAGKWPPQ